MGNYISSVCKSFHFLCIQYLVKKKNVGNFCCHQICKGKIVLLLMKYTQLILQNFNSLNIKHKGNMGGLSQIISYTD